MEMISRGYGIFSLALLIVGLALGRLVVDFFVPTDIVHEVKESGYGLIFCVFGLGIPFALLNNLECKLIWSKVFKNKKLYLLGISIGLVLGISTFMFI